MDRAASPAPQRARKNRKGGDSRPLFLTGEVSLPLLAGLLLPALGFLRHCLLSPPSSGFGLRGRSDAVSGCRLARSPGTSPDASIPFERRDNYAARRAMSSCRTPNGWS